jgi:GTPase
MASVFTFEPEPPRVASPWLQAVDGRGDESESGLERQEGNVNLFATDTGHGANKRKRLQAEPQDGPVEYKLHLLLRPRRKFRSTSTGSHVSGSRHSKLGTSQTSRALSEAAIDTERRLADTTPPPSSTHQTRQHRLEQLTTQLLWRLQQSSPHHSSSATNIILPSLPEALPELHAPRQPGKLLHGLEESQGALYEIGVSDDGTLVGLAEDEMEESLNNLRAMAACLGCVVEVLRKEAVGDCEWVEEVVVGRKERKVRRTGRLFVVEAFVKPHLRSRSPAVTETATSSQHRSEHSVKLDASGANPTTEQLRVTLTGPTMSGKSTLLGTLTTSTLDNGRGKSRLSMLRHRHEITSGVTSSVTQELTGFKEADDGGLDVLNYATENIVSWIDTHVAASDNRLVLISDSAGHPRYRRTTVRGLVGCAPHWTLLCIPADDAEDTAGKSGSTQASQQSLGAAVSDIDLSGAQLDLCLRLRLPMVIVITKLDLASRSGLRESLSKILDVVKSAGKQPVILKNSPVDVDDVGTQHLDAATVESVYRIAVPLLNDPLASVPIVLTSAVEGTGINNLQALLHELPIMDIPESEPLETGFVFHVEDVYHKPAETDGIIISGLLRSGQISVGDSGTLGPFSTHDMDDSEDSEDRPTRRSSAQLPTSRSFPGALGHANSPMPHFQLPGQEWRRFKIQSIRNLRLPVHTLFTDQVGTLAIVPEDGAGAASARALLGRIRKGMVLTAVQPKSTRTFSAEFKREDLESLAVGNHVVVYICSVRASAKVVSARAPDSPVTHVQDENSLEQLSFDFENVHVGPPQPECDGQSEKVAGTITSTTLIVTFRFDASKEYVSIGHQVLVMPGGGPGLYGHGRGEKGVAGLEGFVGTIVETFA